MRLVVSDILRRVAILLEKAEAPIREESKINIKGKPMPFGPARKKTLTRKTKSGDIVELGAVQKKTQTPKAKPPRRVPETEKKWNGEEKTDTMRAYMRDYRNTGRVNETNSPKNKYVKKHRP